MTHADWMKHTYGGVTSTRSDSLKAIDAALATYHRSTFTSERERNLKQLRAALMAWILEKGPNWRTSARNRSNAIDTLYKQVMGIPAVARSGAADAAVTSLELEARALLEKLFRDRAIEYRPGYASILGGSKLEVRLQVRSVNSNVRTLAGTSPRATPPGRPAAPGPLGLGSAQARAEELVRAIVPPAIFADVMVEVTRLIPTFMSDMVAAVTPFLGVIAAGASATWAAKGMIVDEYRRSQAEMHLARSMSKETPEKAIQSVIRIIEREFANSTIVAAVSLGEFAGKLAGALADGGTATTAAIGLAASLAKLANIIRNVARDVEEKNAANKAMKKPIDISIFEICPIVGAYYVCCVPHSVLVNGLLQYLGQHGFNDQVERTISHHIEPIREQARRLIREHRFTLAGLENYPGVMAPNSKALDQMADRVGKTGMVGSGPDTTDWEAIVTRERR